MRPRLTHRAMMDLLEVRSMAQADAEAMDGECAWSIFVSRAEAKRIGL